MDKFKVYIPDSDRVIGGCIRVAIIEAVDEKDALKQAIAKHGVKAIVRKVKSAPIQGEQNA